jgi:hypothetical protein
LTTLFLTKKQFGFDEKINFIYSSLDYEVKHENFFNRGGIRTLKFVKDPNVISADIQMKQSGKTCFIHVKPGLPNTTSKSVD